MSFDEVIPWIILAVSVAGVLFIGVWMQIAATKNWWPFEVKKKKEEAAYNPPMSEDPPDLPIPRIVPKPLDK